MMTVPVTTIQALQPQVVTKATAAGQEVGGLLAVVRVVGNLPAAVAQEADMAVSTSPVREAPTK